MTEQNCPITHQPMPDGYIIHPDCGTQLAAKMGMLPLHMEALQALLRKQIKRGEATGIHAPAQNPAPINLTMLENQAITENTLTTWANEIAQTTNTSPPTKWADYPKYFHTHAQQICRQPYAPNLYDEITHALKYLEHTVETRPQKIFAGRCPQCAKPNYVKTNITVTVCECGQTWDVDSTRLQMMNELKNCWLNMSETLTVVKYFTKPPKRETIRKLAERGRIERRGHGTRALYMPSQIIHAYT